MQCKSVLCAWLYVGLSVVMSKQEGVVMLGGLRQNRAFVSMSSVINPGLMVRVYVSL
jgi:hypothetical protein